MLRTGESWIILLQGFSSNASPTHGAFKMSGTERLLREVRNQGCTVRLFQHVLDQVESVSQLENGACCDL